MTFRDKMWREPLLVGATLFFNVFLYTKTFYACVEILHMQHPNKFFLAPVLLTKFIEFIQYESCSSLGRIKSVMSLVHQLWNCYQSWIFCPHIQSPWRCILHCKLFQIHCMQNLQCRESFKVYTSDWVHSIVYSINNSMGLTNKKCFSSMGQAFNL